MGYIIHIIHIRFLYISFLLGFHKDEVDGSDETEGRCSMVPMELFMLEDEVGNDGKYHKGNALLDHLQLNKVEGTAVVCKAYAVGGNLTAVLEESNHPRESDNQIERPVGGNA